MKTFTIVFLGIVLFIAGYLLGSWRPLSGFIPNPDNIKGNTELKITILDPAGKPVSNLEVDLSEKNGPPAEGGVQKTDNSGIATFNVKPGHYFVFFNTTNFPEKYQVPRESEIDVIEGQSNGVTILLKANQ